LLLICLSEGTQISAFSLQQAATGGLPY